MRRVCAANALALVVLLAQIGQVLGQSSRTLSQECYNEMDRLMNPKLNENYTFWSLRAKDYCKVKFQNTVQNCCGTTGVIPLLTKRGAVTESTYAGWANRYETPVEYKPMWTPIPTPIPTPQPSPQPIPAPTPRPAPKDPPVPPSAIAGEETIVQRTTPRPTPFGDIRPPPLPAEILLLASPATPVMFALGGASEGGVDLSGSSASPPPAPRPKVCKKDCKVDCLMRPREQLCILEQLGVPCTLTTTPLNDFEVQTALHERTPKESQMLQALASLGVDEDFCLPFACDNADDKEALKFAFFPGETQHQMELVCHDPQAGTTAMLTFFISVLCLLLFCCCYAIMKPPKMPREYKIRRSTDD